MRILVVEDDPVLSDGLRVGLSLFGATLDTVSNCADGRAALALTEFDMLFAHLKRILRLDRLRLRGPFGARDEFLLAATAQNLRKLAKLIPLPALKPA